MQLKAVITALAGVMLMTVGSYAQSLSPMHKTGTTPSDVKGFKLLVGNPYKESMTFIVVPMDAGFENLAEHAVTRPAEFKLGAGQQRSVTVAFKIAPGEKERTIGVCVQPKEIEGNVLPRVCGTYTGVMLLPHAGS